MGYGAFSSVNYNLRSVAADYSNKSVHEVFKQKKIHSTMDPCDVSIRECRDSANNPESFPIIIGIDVTGSMGRIPHVLISEGLPKIMEQIMALGVKNPSVIFLAIGDHECDYYPLQIGQFEASDELLEKWLSSICVEEGGGGNGGESYILAHDFAVNHVSADSIEKRGIKGVLITIGDEPPLRIITSEQLKGIYKKGEFRDIDAKAIIAKAQENWNVFHINCTDGSQGQSISTKQSWNELLGENVIHSVTNGLANSIADIILKSYNSSVRVSISDNPISNSPSKENLNNPVIL